MSSMNIKWNEMIAGAMIVVLLVSIQGLPAMAQTDAAAKSLLDNVSKKYAGYQTIKADFSIGTAQANESGTGYSDHGTLLMEAGSNKYHITMSEQDLISDGKSQWTVLKDVKEVHVSDVDESGQSVSPTNIFSFFNSGYKHLTADDEREGNIALHVVELSPEDPRKSQYFKIKLRINKSNNLIRDVTVFDKNGSRYIYEIKNLTPNPSIAANKFTFSSQAYPGMEIIDLR